MKRALVTGISGLLAPYIAERFATDFEIISTSRSAGTHKCNLTNQDDVFSLISETKPDVVLHCAALTDVDYCEAHPEEAALQNTIAVKNIANACPESCQLIYISTDQVYADVKGPHKEPHAAPLNAYGRSKLEGETEALQHPKGLALRTNMFGHSMRTSKKSLSDFFIDAFTKGSKVTLFNDIYFSPLSLVTLSHYIFEAHEMQLTGSYNLGSRDGKTKAKFAEMIAKHLELSMDNATIAPSSQLTNRAPRAKDLTMDVSQFEHALGVAMPTLEQEIRTL